MLLPKNKKDLYFETTTTFNLNYEQPGYSESEIYESALNEKIVQLGMAFDIRFVYFIIENMIFMKSIF